MSVWIMYDHYDHVVLHCFRMEVLSLNWVSPNGMASIKMTRRSCPHGPNILTENLVSIWQMDSHLLHRSSRSSRSSRFRAVQAVKHKPWVELSAFLESSNPGLLWLDVPHQDMVIVWR